LENPSPRLLKKRAHSRGNKKSAVKKRAPEEEGPGGQKLETVIAQVLFLRN